MTLIPVSEIAEQLNRQAASLAKELLPNGFCSGNNWMASGIDDTGKSASLAVSLTGARCGKWTDHGNARAGEEHGDMIDLLALRRYGGDRKAALADAKQRLGIVDDWPAGAPVPRASPEELRARAEEARARDAARQAEDEAARAAKIRGARSLFLHEKAVALRATPAESYLIDRGLSAAPIGEWPGSLRFHPEVWNSEHKVKMPAMLAMIVNANGDHIGTQRTYLQQEGGRWVKIPGKGARKIVGVMGGGFIPINKGSSGKSMRHMSPDEPVYGAEGSEKCIAIRMKMPGARICSLVSLRNMGAVVFPAGVRRLVWITDNPKDDDEMAALEASIARQQARGVTVQQVWPPQPYKDLDEWMNAVAPGPVPQGAAA